MIKLTSEKGKTTSIEMSGTLKDIMNESAQIVRGVYISVSKKNKKMASFYKHFIMNLDSAGVFDDDDEDAESLEIEEEECKEDDEEISKEDAEKIYEGIKKILKDLGELL